MIFERTALSRKPARLAEMELKELRKEDNLSPDLVFRYPYLLDFLGLKDTYAEKDLEAAILREMESFILELGAGFDFLERQKRIIFFLKLLAILGVLAVQSPGHTVNGFINAVLVPWPAPWGGMTGMQLSPLPYSVSPPPHVLTNRTRKSEGADSSASSQNRSTAQFAMEVVI